ncbi:hypothetical protein B4U79_07898, partial [Dinothrombium tinctorium]
QQHRQRLQQPQRQQRLLPQPYNYRPFSKTPDFGQTSRNETSDDSNDDGGNDGSDAYDYFDEDNFESGIISKLDVFETDSNAINFQWKLPKFWELVAKGPQMVRSPRFYLSEPGYRFQLLLTPNTTYTDSSQFLGVFFRLVTGIYDSQLKFPFQRRIVLSLIDRKEKLKNVSFTITPNTDPCRLRSAFLRPSAEFEQIQRPDGCGNRRHMSMKSLRDESDRYTGDDDSLLIGFTVLSDHGEKYREAVVTMKYNHLVSDYVWSINNFSSVVKEASDKETVAVISSEPFYTHPHGYLMQMFLTLLPQKQAFAISTALAQGDYDRYLIWPFPYGFEVAIIDESPGYWQRDYGVNLHPSSSECGTSPFFHPSGYPQFCFITVQSMQLLTLTHYNFIANDTLRIRLTTKLNELSSRESASLRVENGNLYAEYAWIITDIESKIERFDFSGRKVKIYKSNEFYTNGQGYLLQLVLTLNCTEREQSYLGLELAIIEGKYDSVLQWPFNQTFELMIINQRVDDEITSSSQRVNASNRHHQNDVVAVIKPSEEIECDHRSFVKPIEENPPCGRKNLISFTRIKRSNGFLRLGNLLIKTRIHL